MKKYTLLEALNMLKQDKSSVFKIVSGEELCTQTISTDKYGMLVINCNSCHGRDECQLNFDRMWTLEPRPVSFTEALNEALEGNRKLKNIAWVDKPVTLEYVFNLFARTSKSCESGRRLVKSWIKGEWIVEEDD